MALIRCSECRAEISDKASACPTCGAPVDLENSVPAPATLSFSDGLFHATSVQILELAKKAVAAMNYRVDSADAASGTLTFTTGVTMGSWSGVSGTIVWEETTPYHYKVSGKAKQNVQGGQVVALNLFDEANSKARKVIDEMERLGAGGAEDAAPASGCLVLLLGVSGAAVLASQVLWHLL